MADLKLFFVSCADVTKPRGQQAQGVCLVEAARSCCAVTAVKKVKDVDPEGNFLPTEVDPEGEDAKLPRNKFITAAEMLKQEYRVERKTVLHSFKTIVSKN